MWCAFGGNIFSLSLSVCFYCAFVVKMFPLEVGTKGGTFSFFYPQALFCVVQSPQEAKE
jgi:hypothetical protein